jgi:hypothetical protein
VKRPYPEQRGRVLSRLARVARGEYGLCPVALGAIGLHVLDDNFLQPQPGTSAGDHLVSGLVPLALLVLTAMMYPRLRAGFRATLALTLGVLCVVAGAGEAAYYAVKVGPRATTTRAFSPSPPGSSSPRRRVTSGPRETRPSSMRTDARRHTTNSRLLNRSRRRGRNQRMASWSAAIAPLVGLGHTSRCKVLVTSTSRRATCLVPRLDLLRAGFASATIHHTIRTIPAGRAATSARSLKSTDIRCDSGNKVVRWQSGA